LLSLESRIFKLGSNGLFVLIFIVFHFKIINYFLTEKLLVRLEPLSMINAVRAATLGDGSYTITTAIQKLK